MSRRIMSHTSSLVACAREGSEVARMFDERQKAVRRDGDGVGCHSVSGESEI
ncbi:MAG: hypothetical protein K0S70_892 [Microbacterium sp.]|nr:hypothetical protein [Microbacterium sp.]